MGPITNVETEWILSGKSDWIGPEFAATLSQHPLDSIETEFPHFVRSVESPKGPERPRDRHPVFYGCYDWHSSVHSHWALLRQLRLFDDHPAAAEITASIDARVTADNVAREVDCFEANESFEKPYGWAWLLHLAAELHLWNSGQAAAWREVIEPLEQKIVSLVESEFLTQDRPFRVGTHQNSAFSNPAAKTKILRFRFFAMLFSTSLSTGLVFFGPSEALFYYDAGPLFLGTEVGSGSIIPSAV
ncbi:DUF2891 family protein [Halostagnicola sp. A56]|uniref:DUF2891 family protein n=1 Tax=Halostagnicola sp. A56 TaxID=1495067 RepID=UPI0009E1C2D1|nr:DUF2891 family protein [Halostagnicola sp. A56]